MCVIRQRLIRPSSESIRHTRARIRSDKDHKKQAAIPATSSNRSAPARVDESARKRVLVVHSQAERPLHASQSSVPRVRAALLQSLRPLAQHELPRRLAQSNAQVRSAALYRPHVLVHVRVEHHSLRSQAREHSFVQS